MLLIRFCAQRTSKWTKGEGLVITPVIDTEPCIAKPPAQAVIVLVSKFDVN
jgi:hypothetical protein